MARTSFTNLMTRTAFREAAENNTVELYSSVENTTKVLVTGTITLDDTAFGKWHHCSGTSGDYSITLPTAVGNEGKMILFTGDADIAVLSKLVTIDGDGTEKINNALTLAITTKGYLTLIARVTSGVGSWDVVSFDQGMYYAFTVTWTGFTVDPAGSYLFKRGLGFVDLSFYTVTPGTGTGTTVTFLLPLGLTAKALQRLLMAFYVNNASNATVPGAIIIAADTNSVSCYTTVAAGAWTGSNNRSVTGSWRISTNE